MSERNSKVGPQFVPLTFGSFVLGTNDGAGSQWIHLWIFLGSGSIFLGSTNNFELYI